MNPPSIRVIQDPPLAGPANMARDEALLTRVGMRQSPPTMRLYQWAAPTVSLGYFQHFAHFESLDSPVGGLQVVRRTTGGGAIVHDRELTYSLTLPLDHVLLASGPNALYEIVHDGLIECLKRYGLQAHRDGESDGSGAAKGPFFCFARRHCLDVLVGDHKIAGSSQRRTKNAVLQHGSIILGSRFDQQQTVLVDMDVEHTVERLRNEFPQTLSRLTGQRFDTGEWTSQELSESEALVAKYAGSDWTRRR